MSTKYSGNYVGLLLIIFLLISNFALAEPAIDAVTGDIAKDGSLIINGSLFTTKVNPKPLFWWKADFGINPSILGRKTEWDGRFGGDISTIVVASGSQKSVAFDHGTVTGAALGSVAFNSDRIYLYRKTYTDFDIAKDFSIRTKVSVVEGSVNAGDIITGITSGAVGVVQKIDAINNPYSTHVIFYTNSDGTVTGPSPTDFIFGETMTTTSATMTNAEGSSKYPTGTLKSFNFKTIRFWANSGFQGNNFHLNAQGTDTHTAFRITPEHTDGTTWGSKFTNKTLYQMPNIWKSEEVEYKVSSIGISDGIWKFYQNGILGTDNTFITRNTKWPNRYSIIYQSQVSNGAQPGSIMYYDSLYVDDTWHRVLICPEVTWSTRSNCEVQIPSVWNDSQVTVHVNKGGLDMSKTSYLYVIDKNGIANENGWPLIP